MLESSDERSDLFASKLEVGPLNVRFEIGEEADSHVARILRNGSLAPLPNGGTGEAFGCILME